MLQKEDTQMSERERKSYGQHLFDSRFRKEVTTRRASATEGATLKARQSHSFRYFYIFLSLPFAFDYSVVIFFLQHLLLSTDCPKYIYFFAFLVKIYDKHLFCCQKHTNTTVSGENLMVDQNLVIFWREFDIVKIFQKLVGFKRSSLLPFWLISLSICMRQTDCH